MEDATIYENHNYISLAAAASILLSCKLHEGKSMLTMANFPVYKKADLIDFERKLLHKLEYQISPLTTPSSFVRHLLGLCPELEEYHVKLIHQCAQFISEYQEQTYYLRFMPSTIAISVLLLSFSVFDIDGSEWLRRIPDACIPKEDSKNSNVHELLSIDKCLEFFQSQDDGQVNTKVKT